MATVAAAQDAGANPPKECDKLIKDYEKQGVQGLVDTLQQVQAAPDDTDVVEGLQKLLPCSGFDSECQGIVAPILGANCLAEIVAVAGWVNKGGDAANASESIPEIKEALGPCCEGTITEPCCDSLPPLIASYGPNGWRGGCLCETNATERILGPDHEAFLSQVLQVVAGLGCDRMSSVPDVDPDTKVFPECAQQ
ncbi:hypothetical protein HOP50_11g61280 [Chloropicon primus]|uniref:Uncharacterized protein n=1 Tax=Chloropicon primus TaxID=1764295 RepID=A0A5B8MSH2_9CHLO|nr:hypothetical protein A3770_11p61070 [Chloropicon primus]UPR02801.1 hypothetical protein HOP50_11g61280 [Chloropicon primus]|eukprot:QDZ23589.1 hypothetical protein A3770_11p61070 [Chloropicon primus]